MLKNIRVTAIQKLIHLNEHIIFYPKLKRFYKANIQEASPVILDIGANKGQSIDFFLSIFPDARIYAFEPNKKLYNKLVARYSGNSNIRLYNLGLSNKNGTLQFCESVMDETSTFEPLNPESVYLKKKAGILGVRPEDIFVDKYDVQVVTLSAFIAEHHIDKIDVIKVDVEGHELPVFHGLFQPVLNSAIEFIQFESHNDDMYMHHNQQSLITALLTKNSFKPNASIRHSFGDFDEIIYKRS